MRINYSITLEDFRRGTKVFCQIRSRKRGLALPPLLYRLVGALFLLNGIAIVWRVPDSSGVGAVILLFGAYFLFMPLISRWYTARVYSRQKLGEQMSLDLDDLQVHAERSDGQGDSTWKWGLLDKWGESPEVFVILPNAMSFIPVPKRVLTVEQQDELRTLLAAHIPNKN